MTQTGAGWPTLAIAALVLAGCASASTPMSGDHSGDFIGHRWRITVVQHGQSRSVVPAGLGAWLEFTSTGAFGANDSINGYGGTFKRAPRGFRVNGDVVGSAAGVGRLPGAPTSALVVVAAIREMIVDRPEVDAHVQSGQLQVAMPDYQISGVAIS
jgi:hypothetical protein